MHEFVRRTGTRAGCSSAGWRRSTSSPSSSTRATSSSRSPASTACLPARAFVRDVPFRSSPSLFYWLPTDRAFRAGAWARRRALGRRADRRSQRAGARCRRRSSGRRCTSSICRSSTSARPSTASAGSRCCVEIGFFTIFAGASFTPPHALLNWIYRWTLFRLMFGAGLIKLRGDACWRDLHLPGLLLRDAADAEPAAAGISTTCRGRCFTAASCSTTSSS